MSINKIQSSLQAIVTNTSLFDELNFNEREEMIDFIEFHILHRIDGLCQAQIRSNDLEVLKKDAECMLRQLTEVNTSLFERIRSEISIGNHRGTDFIALIERYSGVRSSNLKAQNHVGYDVLDAFVNGLMLAQPLPVETKQRGPEMVYYQQTPARIIVALAERACLTKQDVFYDLGSGLGHVPILVNLLTGVTTKGVEFEPAYCAYASACARAFNLTRVLFINMDARQADYEDGTVFFLYTPFKGRILQQVLDKLYQEAQRRPIRVFTYGACSLSVSQQPWLYCMDPRGVDPDQLCMFHTT
ncbi:MAG: hypothetical protein AAF639_07200 [Chloroflexota bacterium]